MPELCLYDGEAAHIYHLSSLGYVLAEASRALPVLTSGALSRFIGEGQARPVRAVLKSLRQRLRADGPSGTPAERNRVAP